MQEKHLDNCSKNGRTLESEDDTIESGVEESSNEADMRRKIHGSKAVSTDFD